MTCLRGMHTVPQPVAFIGCGGFHLLKQLLHRHKQQTVLFSHTLGCSLPQGRFLQIVFPTAGGLIRIAGSAAMKIKRLKNKDLYARQFPLQLLDQQAIDHFILLFVSAVIVGIAMPHLVDAHQNRDIIGLEVVDADDGTVYGKVDEIYQNGGADVYSIKTSDGKQLMFPAIPEVLINTDVDNGKIEIRPLDGLFDIYRGKGENGDED